MRIAAEIWREENCKEHLQAERQRRKAKRERNLNTPGKCFPFIVLNMLSKNQGLFWNGYAAEQFVLLMKISLLDQPSGLWYHPGLCWLQDASCMVNSLPFRLLHHFLYPFHIGAKEISYMGPLNVFKNGKLTSFAWEEFTCSYIQVPHGQEILFLLLSTVFFI